jgi:hypothetical protein
VGLFHPIIEEVTKPAGDYNWTDISGNAPDVISMDLYVPIGPWEAVVKIQSIARAYIARCYVADILTNLKLTEDQELSNAASLTITRCVVLLPN